jgi:2-oxoglutarate ferredoxin oxidoreductase subunit gamma
MRQEIRLAGFGGQGIILAGVILGEGAVLDGNEAVQTQSYGPESRGGAARSEVVISDEDIDYPRVISPDIMIALSQPGFESYYKDLSPNSILIVDEDMVKTDKLKGQIKARIFKAPFSKTADQLGNRIITNIIMLGCITAATGVVSEKNMMIAVKARVPKKFEELNVKGFKKGFEIGKKITGAKVGKSKASKPKKKKAPPKRARKKKRGGRR